MLERKMNLIPCSKHLCETLRTEIESFGPFLKNIMELLEDDMDKEVEDLWMKTLNMIYNVDYFIRLCLIGRFSTWYGIIALPDVIEHIKFIKIQINTLVGVDKIHNKKKIDGREQMEGNDALRPRGMEGTENDYMGFEEVEENIINDLTRGRMSLTVISISGSGGQGKTTLAKRIYDNSNVQCHFQKVVWCYVSKDFYLKDLLIQIMCDNAKGDGGTEMEMKNTIKCASKMEMQDLNENVWRSFKRKPYFIVLDDIWDIYAWGQLKSLFPDDKNGSRILFTSRNQELASQVKLNSISRPLELFDDGESWELIKNRVFGPSDCDKEFEKIGRKIASCCKGLPLVVALIAGVLGRTEHKFDSWNKVVENMKTHLSQDGCGNVLELSYRYLPDHLKPCFLYFAAFGRGKKPIAKRLKLLWIGEGFVNQYEGMKPSGKDLATEYLTDLVSLGLVVKERSSTKGGIKQCSIHDFLYDLCLEKAKENNFMHWAELNSCYEWNIHSSYGMVNCNHHQLSISKCDPFIKSSPIVARRDLPKSSLHSFLCTSYASRDSSLRFLESFKILTILKLKLRIKEFPEVILSSICLRYLSLHFEEVIEAIPPTIANLWKLRNLIIRIRTYSLTMLLLVMWNMMSLRHVNIRNAFIDLLGFDPENSSKSNIESLGFIYSDDDYRTTTKFFSKFPNLRKLKYTTRERRIPELLSIVGSLPIQLESLYFGFEGDIDENPHLIVWNFPKIRYLTKLKLYGTQLSWSVLSEIGKHLPNLHVLKLFTGSCKMEDGAFLNLIYLMLVNLSIEEFDISYCDDPLPCLEYLHLNFCKELVEIPPVFGEINTLKEIKVFRCSNELGASAIRILEERREFGNDNFQVFGEGEI